MFLTKMQITLDLQTAFLYQTLWFEEGYLCITLICTSQWHDLKMVYINANK